MTPLIKTAVKILDGPNTDITKMGWFDMSNSIKAYPEKVVKEAMGHPSPFENYVVCGTLNTAAVILLVVDKDGLVVIKSWAVANNRYAPMGSVAFQREDGRVRFVTAKDSGFIDPEEADAKTRERLVQMLAMFFCGLIENQTTLYQPVVKNTFTNRRLKQKGKPLHYEWKTVIIGPSKQKRESLGGTHASPRLHDRRGHWRTMKKSGKKVWVKQCRVGDAARGMVLHDYKFREPQ